LAQKLEPPLEPPPQLLPGGLGGVGDDEPSDGFGAEGDGDDELEPNDDVGGRGGDGGAAGRGG
jgi:hypothetical protein